jgi:hypothetical protein
MTKTKRQNQPKPALKNPFASLYDDEDDDDLSSSSTSTSTSTSSTATKKTKKSAVVTPAPWAKNWTPERKGWAYSSDDEED